MWSLSIRRNDPAHAGLHAAVANLLKHFLMRQISDVSRARSMKFGGPIENLRYTWRLLRDNLHGCHVYLTPHEIYVRPLIPPTWSQSPFAAARQRIYMSATLDDGGDLERLTHPDLQAEFMDIPP